MAKKKQDPEVITETVYVDRERDMHWYEDLSIIVGTLSLIAIVIFLVYSTVCFVRDINSTNEWVKEQKHTISRSYRPYSPNCIHQLNADGATVSIMCGN